MMPDFGEPQGYTRTEEYLLSRCADLEAKLEQAEALMLLVSQCANGSPAMDNAIEACRQEYRKSQQQQGGGTTKNNIYLDGMWLRGEKISSDSATTYHEKESDTKADKEIIRLLREGAEIQKNEIKAVEENYHDIRKQQPKPKLEPRDLAGWWIRDTKGTWAEQINGFSDTKVSCAPVVWALNEIDLSFIFSKDPQLPLDQWLSLDQVAESLGKEVVE